MGRPSGAAGAFPAGNPDDVLIDLAGALGSGYRQNGTFVMNRKTQSAIRKFKDSTGNDLWATGLQARQPATLLGHPVEVDDTMPDIAANSLSIALGDFRRGYLVVDRQGREFACCAIRSLRSPTSCSTPPSASAAACRTSTRSS